MSAYSSLNRAQLSFDYLHTNSTTHEFLFGGLAELIDNARDALATKMEVYTEPAEGVRGGFLLCFSDDGHGMSPDECADVITFGRSAKRSLDSNMIGMYGNGLKSGTMRMGKDFILLTKKGETMSCLLLSRTFHEDEGIDEVIVPLPSFTVSDRKPIADNMGRHKMEMDLIYKYSPFKTSADLFRQFDKIELTGTLIVVYNVKLLDDGQPELDIHSDQYDILLANGTGVDGQDSSPLPSERRSFRSYASILYADPVMKVYIQGKKVRTRRLANCLYKPRLYKYSSARFKTRAEADAKSALEESKKIEEKAKEAETKAKLFESKHSRLTKDQRAELRILQTTAANLKKDAQLKKQMADRKSKSLKEPKTLHFIFGMNIDDRNQDGLFIYNCSRLIKMYTKVGPQVEGGINCSGVLGTVDVPYLVLEPTHNKQDFADAREYRYLLKAMADHMVQYWKDVGIEIQGPTRFWESFGYISDKWQDPPSDDPKYLRKRAMQVPITLQCDSCLKWRILPFSNANMGRVFPDKWVCNMNQDHTHNKCSIAEQKVNMTEGVLRREARSKEQKQQDLEDEIRKKQEQLDKLQKVKAVTSDYQARQLEKEREEERKIQEAERKEREAEKREAEKKKKEAEKKKQAELEKRRQEAIARQKAAMEARRAPAVTTPRRAVITPKQPARKPPPPPKPAPARRRAQPQPSESEESEESEEEAARPTKRQAAQRTPAAKPAPQSRVPDTSVTSPRAAVKRPQSTSQDEEPPSKRAAAVVTNDKTATPRVPDTSAGKNEQASSSEPDTDSGQACEARILNEWYPAKIVQVNKKTRKWKVKFDKNPKDKYDKWFDFDSADIKFPKGEEPDYLTNNHEAPEPPSSSTSNDEATKLVEPIAEGYRTCLRYFLPPQWGMEKETISQLTVSELANFPLDDFFDHYEKGLRKLVNNFQTEAQSKQREADQANAKLSQLRRHIAKLLKTINEDFDIDADTDSEQVDELLSACLKQALETSQP